MKSRLAIDGGSPVRDAYLPYARQSIDEEDIAEVTRVLRSEWLTTGPKVEEFEENVAARVGARYAVSFSSGTAALHGAAVAAQLGPGDEAITTPLTFAATANCVLYTGATPVFADVCDDTLNIDPDQIERKVTPRTKAILPVHYGGNPADMDRIRGIAEKHGLIVIEDAAHALGAVYRGSVVGTIGEMAMFSFHPVKHVTTGEGGMITTGKEEYRDVLRVFRNQGLSTDAHQRKIRGSWFYEMTMLGFNYRLTDVACALGISQMKRLDCNLKRRKEIASEYRSALSSLPGLILPYVGPEVESAWHLYPVRFNPRAFSAGRDRIFQALRAENIGVNVHYIPVHLHPYYRNRCGTAPGMCPIAEGAYESLITLPLFHSMIQQDVQDVIEAVRKVHEHFLR